MDHPADQKHILWGALVGGPDSGDWHRDITKDYVYNEVAVDYNAAVVGACAGLYHFFGTDDMKIEEDFPIKEESYKSAEELQEFNLKAAVGQEDNMATQILIEFRNQTTRPPRYLNEIKIRYYFDISEILQGGGKFEDIQIRPDYDMMASDTNKKYEVKYEIVQYDEKGGCYVELTWPAYKFYGKMAYQFAIMDQKQNENYEFIWDPTNDYSRQGIVSAEEKGVSLNAAPEEFDGITMYVDGKQVWGKAPAGADIGGNNEKQTTTSASTDNKGKLLYGDVNCNGTVDVVDAVLLARVVGGDSTAQLTDQGAKNADVKKDSKTDPKDLTLLLRFLARLVGADELGK